MRKRQSSTDASRPIVVVLLLDNRVLRDAVGKMLSRERDLHVISAGSTATAQRFLNPTRPTVVIIDGNHPDADARVLVSGLKRASPSASVLVMDPPPVAPVMIEFVKAGASGFIAKDASVTDLLFTIRSAGRGLQILPTALTATLFDYIARANIQPTLPDPDATHRMTPREREVFDLVGNGLSNKAIARRLDITTNTVKGHVHNILEKTALHTRVELALRARTGAL